MLVRDSAKVALKPGQGFRVDEEYAIAMRGIVNDVRCWGVVGGWEGDGRGGGCIDHYVFQAFVIDGVCDQIVEYQTEIYALATIHLVGVLRKPLFNLYSLLFLDDLIGIASLCLQP